MTAKLNVFIASSYLSHHIAMNLKGELDKEPTISVHFWKDVYDKVQSEQYGKVFVQKVGVMDLFIILLGNEAEYNVQEKGDVGKYRIPTDNMLFELGAAWGRLHHFQIIMVRDPNAKMPSDLKALTMIDSFAFSDLNRTESIQTLANRITSIIRDEKINLLTKKRREERIPFLSLMNCRFGRQGRVLRTLESLKHGAKKSWDVDIVEAGVVWGPPDNFLLYTVPSVEHFVDFVTSFRKEYSGFVRAVDSRMVFPKRFWHESFDFQRESQQRPYRHLVLLSCPPKSVESVYDKIRRTAEDESVTELNNEVNITSVGVLTGESDVFFITSSVSVEAHHTLIQKYFHRIITEDLGRDEWESFDNTCSLLITGAPIED